MENEKISFLKSLRDKELLEIKEIATDSNQFIKNCRKSSFVKLINPPIFAYDDLSRKIGTKMYRGIRNNFAFFETVCTEWLNETEKEPEIFTKKLLDWRTDRHIEWLLNVHYKEKIADYSFSFSTNPIDNLKSIWELEELLKVQKIFASILEETHR